MNEEVRAGNMSGEEISKALETTYGVYVVSGSRGQELSSLRAGMGMQIGP